MLPRRFIGLVLATAWLSAACGFVTTTPPAPTPADFIGLSSELAGRGIAIGHVVSGEAGCADPVLTPTAIAFDASGLDQDDAVRVYLYVFRNRDVFERLRSTIDACAASFVTDPESFESIEESPFVVAGQGPWGGRFEAALREGLTAAAGNGG